MLVFWRKHFKQIMFWCGHPKLQTASCMTRSKKKERGPGDVLWLDVSFTVHSAKSYTDWIDQQSNWNVKKKIGLKVTLPGVSIEIAWRVVHHQEQGCRVRVIFKGTYCQVGTNGHVGMNMLIKGIFEVVTAGKDHAWFEHGPCSNKEMVPDWVPVNSPIHELFPD